MADKWQALEEEMKLLKNEIKQVLIDIKERIDNPSAQASLQPNVKKVSLSPAAKAEEEPKVEPTMPKMEPTNEKDDTGGPKIMEDKMISGNGNGNGNGHGNGHSNGNGNGNGNGKAAQDAMPGTFKMGNISLQEDFNKMPRNPQMVPGNKDYGFGFNGSQPVNEAPPATRGPSVDLMTVAMLSRWLANGVKKVGRQRMEVLVDIYSQLGGFPAPLRDTMMKLLNTDEGDGQSMHEGVSLLIELDNLVQRSLTDKNEAAVLSLFLNGNGKNGNGKEAFHR